MKKGFCLLFIVLVLTGCSKNDTMNRALDLRSRFQSSEGCTFSATITADYGQTIHEFAMECRTDSLGNLEFYVISPESISGITGSISNDGGKLVFDDSVLAFETLTQGQINPISAPWILIRSLACGYLSSTSDEGEFLRVSVNDTYQEDALHLDIWLDEENRPVFGEILWDGRRILSVKVDNFVIL